MMEETLYDQLSAREKKIIRQSLDPDIRFYHKSPQNSPRNTLRTSKELITQNSMPKVENDEEKESNSVTDKEENSENDNSEIQNVSEKKSETSEAQSQKTEEKNDDKTDNEEVCEEEQESIEGGQDNMSLSAQGDANEDSIKIDLDETDILSQKLSEMSLRHTIQQKILIQQAEMNLKKNNYSPGSLRGFIIKSNNLKQKRQEEMIRIYEKYGTPNKANKQYSQKIRSKSEKPVNNQRDFNSARALNLTPRLSMFASSNRVLRPNPRFSTPTSGVREQDGTEHTEHIKLPPVSQSQQIPNQISLFETQSEKVYHSEKVFSSSLDDPFSIILSQQELAPSPSIRLNVKPPPPPPKKAASPRKQSKKKSRSSRLSKSSKMGRNRNVSEMSTVSQEPSEPPPPPIKRHILTMRASLIPKNGIIDIDKRDFLDFLNDKEEDIPVEIKEEPDESEKESMKSSKSRSKSKLRNKTKSKASSKK